MRRALREEWPALSHFYGLKPWDVDPANPGCLSYGEVHAYRDELRRMATDDPR